MFVFKWEDSEESDVNECMNMLNIGESVCTSGISDKMLQIGHLVFSIIGANKINLIDLDIESDFYYTPIEILHYACNHMIDKLQLFSDI